MQNISTLPLRQESFLESKNSENINNAISYGTIESATCGLSTVSGLEELSVARGKEALKKVLFGSKEIAQVFSNLDEAREAVRIHNERQASFARQQVTRAKKYNIPYSYYTVDIYKLSKEIDSYEFLLGEAKDLNIDWDTSEYDPLALEQAIEDARHNAYI